METGHMTVSLLVNIGGDKCYEKCVDTPNCTHYTSTRINNVDWCQMKTGRRCRSEAKTKQGSNCGLRYLSCIDKDHPDLNIGDGIRKLYIRIYLH